jgi:hypothetical protein
MKLTGTHAFAAPPERVFAALTDPAVLQSCIEGCEKMEKTAEGAYDVHLKLGVAGVKGNYLGKVEVRDPKPPESFTLAVEGKGGPGWIKGLAKITLKAADGGTVLTADGDGQVGGLIAAVGSRLIEAVAKKMMAEFFRKLGERIEKA